VDAMKEVKEIRTVRVDGEFRVCPDCGYTLGFHTSVVDPCAGTDTPVKSTKKLYTVILICPECGARYDVGWKISLTEGSPCFVTLPVAKK